MTRAEEVSDEMLMALADGELSQTDARHLHKRIAGDPEIAARYADFVDTRALTQAAFPAEPVPERLIAAVLQGDRAQGTVLPFRRRVGAAVFGWGAALAASVVLAVGGFWAGRETAPRISPVASLGAATAQLPTGSTVQLPDGSTARVLASYDTDLGLCRLIGQDARRHVTCRDAQTGNWALALSVQAGEATGFLPASDIAVGLIDRLLDDIGAGPALSAEAERRALDR